jgi:hypothetical protein
MWSGAKKTRAIATHSRFGNIDFVRILYDYESTVYSVHTDTVVYDW